MQQAFFFLEQFEVEPKESKDTKCCTKCGKEKPLEEFTVDKSRADFRRNECKPCTSVLKKQIYNARKTAPPVPPCCENCGREFSPIRKAVLDHSHKTGLFRGWICNSCNSGLGQFGDSPELLQKAIDYLNKHDG
jgi:hypothetical protein